MNNNSKTVIKSLETQSLSERDIELIYEAERKGKNRNEVIRTLKNLQM